MEGPIDRADRAVERHVVRNPREAFEHLARFYERLHRLQRSAERPCNKQHTTCNKQHTPCSIQHAAYNIERFSQRSLRPQRALLTDLFTSAYRVIRCGAGRDAAAAEWNTVVRLAGIDQLSIASAAPLVYLLSTYAK